MDACNDVFPCESASDNGSGFFANPLGINLSDPTLFTRFTSDDYIKISEKCGVDAANKFLDFSRNQNEHIDRLVSVHCGAVRIASSRSGSESSSRTGSGVAGKVSGLSQSRVQAINRSVSWRPSVNIDGFCYSKMFSSNFMQQNVQRLGRWPTLTSLLKTSASQFKSINVLSKFKYEGDSSSGHLLEETSSGQNFMALVAKYSSGVKFSPGTLGAVVNASGISTLSCGYRLKGSTIVGGVVVGDDGFELTELDGTVPENPQKLQDTMVRTTKDYRYLCNMLGKGGRTVIDLRRHPNPRLSLWRDFEMLTQYAPEIYDCLSRRGMVGTLSAVLDEPSESDAVNLSNVLLHAGFRLSSDKLGSLTYTYVGSSDLVAS